MIALFLLLVIGILYTRSDMLGINPLLAVFGYHVVKVEWAGTNWQKPKEALVISRLDYYEFRQQPTVLAIQMQNELYLHKGGENDR